MYDKALIFTDAEYDQQYSQNIKLQTVVEKPYRYMFAHCLPTDEQFQYALTRVEGIKELGNDLQNLQRGDMPVIIRFSHGVNKLIKSRQVN